MSADVVIYAKKADGKFDDFSEAVLLELPEEYLKLLSKDVAEKYCPGFDYLLECFKVKEMAEEIRAMPEYQIIDQQVRRVIYYAEFEA